MTEIAAGGDAQGLVCPLLTSAAGENFWAVTAVWLPVTALLAAMARIYVTRKRAGTAASHRPAVEPGE